MFTWLFKLSSCIFLLGCLKSVAVSALLCFPVPLCLWIFLSAFLSRCSMPPHPGSDPRQTLNASHCIAMTLPTHKHNHAATIQTNQMTPVFFSSEPIPLKSAEFCSFQNWELQTFFFVLISFIYPILGRCSPLVNPPFLSFTFFFFSSVRRRAGHNEDYRRANIRHISLIHVSTWKFMWLLLFAKSPNSSAWLNL